MCSVLLPQATCFTRYSARFQDAYEATGYRLAPDSPAALRSGGGGRERRRGLEQAAGQRAKHLVKVRFTIMACACYVAACAELGFRVTGIFVTSAPAWALHRYA